MAQHFSCVNANKSFSSVPSPAQLPGETHEYGKGKLTNISMTYDEFIASKTKQHVAAGFEPKQIRAPLFEWQKAVVRWAIRTGRAALFEECGLGKTLQQLEWARQVANHTQAPVLILTPLAVAHQTQEEGHKFGIKAKVVNAQ